MTDAPTPEAREGSPHASTAFALGVVAFLVFLPALGNGFISNWDDDLSVLTNTHIRTLDPTSLGWMFTSFRGGHLQPLSWLTMAIDYQLWGLDPKGHHLTSLVFHAINTVIFFYVLVRLLEFGGRGTLAAPVLVRSAAIGALAFALHPMRVESVVWATARRDLVSGLFYLLTILAYLRSWRDLQHRPRWLLASLGLYLLSLLSKSWGMTLPVVLLAIDWYRTRRLTRTLVLEKVPFFALGRAAAGVAVCASNAVGALRPLSDHGPLERLLQVGYAAVFHVRKMAVPLDLSPLYSLEQDISPFDPKYALSLLALSAGSIVLFRARRTQPAAFMAMLSYLAIISPVLGVGQSGPQVGADRYTYLSCLPLVVLAAAGLCRVQRNANRAAIAASAYLVVLVLLTLRQVTYWESPLTLWTRATQVDGQNSAARYNRGLARYDLGDARGSIEDFDEALRLKANVPEVYNARGNARDALGDRPGAISDFDRALALHPGFAMAYNNRGVAKLATGDLRGAGADFERAVQVKDDLAQAHANRAWVSGQLGDLDRAFAACVRATTLDPGLPEGFATCGRIKEKRGDIPGAIASFRRALEIAPREWPHRGRVQDHLRRLSGTPQSRPR
jgi:tetratricopeptide (TPR) repeat protein